MATMIHTVGVVSTDPGVRNGRPCIAGTGLEVSVIVIAKIVHGQSPEEIASDYELSLPQVYGALVYYYEHKAEMDTLMHERRRLAESYREQRLGSRH